MTTAYAFERAPRHVYAGHPESPERLGIVQSRLDAIAAQQLRTRAATREEISRVHKKQMIEWLEEACSHGQALIDPAPTFVTHTSLDDALLAAGATLECLRVVLASEVDNAFAIVRPPGHHAEPGRSMGFCIFNNVAVAAAEALRAGVRRVAVVDYDAHHGNGTQAAFLEDERLAYFSTHQWGIYPGTGWFEDAPLARRRIVNVPLPAGAGDESYSHVWRRVLQPFMRAFRPELILASAGFDGHWNDPITSLGLSTAGFYALSADLVGMAEEHAGGKIVFVLEGGYDPANVANGVEAVFAALMKKPYVAPVETPPGDEPEVGQLLQDIRSLHGFAR